MSISKQTFESEITPAGFIEALIKEISIDKRAVWKQLEKGCDHNSR